MVCMISGIFHKLKALLCQVPFWEKSFILLRCAFCARPFWSRCCVLAQVCRKLLYITVFFDWSQQMGFCILLNNFLKRKTQSLAALLFPSIYNKNKHFLLPQSTFFYDPPQLWKLQPDFVNIHCIMKPKVEDFRTLWWPEITNGEHWHREHGFLMPLMLWYHNANIYRRQDLEITEIYQWQTLHI